MIKSQKLLSSLGIWMLILPASYAGNVTIPNSFTSGTPAVAADVNANFSAVETEVNDNHARLLSVESDTQALKLDVNAIDNSFPVIIHNAPATIESGSPDVTIEFDLSDNTELGSFIIQRDDKSITAQYFEPGINNTSVSVTEVITGDIIKLLAITNDTSGNMTKALINIAVVCTDGDCDNDGYLALSAGGSDCHDGNTEVNPGVTNFFSYMYESEQVPGELSFDYNCDGIEQKLYTGIFTQSNIITSATTCTTNVTGWLNTEANCGQTGQWGQAGRSYFYSGGICNISTRIQVCN